MRNMRKRQKKEYFFKEKIKEIRRCESAFFLNHGQARNLCDTVGLGDEKQTRTLTNDKDRHNN